MEKGSSLGRAYQLFHLPSPYQINRFSHLTRLSLAPLNATIIHPHSPLIRSRHHPKSLVNRPKIANHLPYLRTRKTPIFNPDYVSGKQRIIAIKYFVPNVILIPISTRLCLDRHITASQKRHRNAQNALFLLVFA